MAKEDGDPGPLEDIPDVDGVVIVAGKQQATTEGEVHAGGSEYDALLGVDGHLPVRAEVVEPTRSII